jgi:hypothetical protein
MLNKDIEILFRNAGGYIETDANGNSFTYTQDFDPDKFARLIIEDVNLTLVNHGYTDAAECLKEHYKEDWVKFEFPEI